MIKELWKTLKDSVNYYAEQEKLFANLKCINTKSEAIITLINTFPKKYRKFLTKLVYNCSVADKNNDEILNKILFYLTFWG